MCGGDFIPFYSRHYRVSRSLDIALRGRSSEDINKFPSSLPFIAVPFWLQLAYSRTLGCAVVISVGPRAVSLIMVTAEVLLLLMKRVLGSTN